MPSERNGHSALRTPHSAFTLIEMLTVIAIIGILAAILIPTVQAAMRKARIVQATADIRQLDQAATAYNLDFGAFPPDCTAFMYSTDINGNVQSDIPFPGGWNANAQAPFYTPLNPNELLMWYLTRQYSTGQYNPLTKTYPAGGYPYGYPASEPTPAVDTMGWPAVTNVVFARGSNANTGPYMTIKAKQRTDYNTNGYYEFMDPWGRPYMYRAYPQTVANGIEPGTGNAVNFGAKVYGISGNQVTLTLNRPLDPRAAGGFPTVPPPNPFNNAQYIHNSDGYYSYTYFNTNSVLTGTTGSIELSGFTPTSFNGVYTFTSASPTSDPNPWNNTYVTVTSANPPAVNAVGSYSFPLHNRQSCDIYSLGPYGMTRSALSMAAQQVNGAWVGTEWKPTHGGGAVGGGQLLDLPWNCPSSLDAWPQVWGTPGDGNDINSPSGNTIVNSQYQDNICNW